MEEITPNGEFAKNNLIQECYMKRLFPLLCMIFLSVNMVTLALTLEKAPCCRLQSIIQTSSLDSSLKKLDFSYDLSNRFTEEVVTSVNSEYPNSSYFYRHS